MKRNLQTWAALLAMTAMLFAFAGCSSDDDTTGPGTTPVDETAVVMAAGDAYFTTYMIDSNDDGVRNMGVNIPPSSSTGTGLVDVINDANYYIVDWRGAADYGYAHIPGAVNKVLGNLVSELDTLPTDKIIVNVCYTGQTASVATAAINILGTQTGHKAINLKFGMSEWAPLNMVKADGTFGYPTDTSMTASLTDVPAARGAAGDLPAFATGETADLEILKARVQVALNKWPAPVMVSLDQVFPVDTTNTYLVNYFSSTAYAVGHVPGAIWYNSAPSEFVDEASLATLPTDQQVAVYCYTGQTSAQLTFYLNMLGYDAKSVSYGVQNFAYDHAVNTVVWHEATDVFPLEGTGVSQ